jgi:peptidoglycan/xylan/chitin deacetylase (PgdA/CDA1 family)
VSFLVFVHDVAVAQRAELDQLWSALRPRVGAQLHVACIGAAAQQHPTQTIELVSSWSREVEIVAHGQLHQRPPSLDPFSWVTGRSDEFAALPATIAEGRVRQSRELLEALFRRPVRGFVPPAFRFGTLTLAALLRAGYTYAAGLAWLRHRGGRVPLGTYAWDAGHLSVLFPGLEAMGHVLAARPGALPCVVLHPADVRRGLVPRALLRIDALLERGLRPVRLGDLELGPTRQEAPCGW